MAKTSLKDRVTTLLRRLGGSADEVAQKLRRRRIKGHRLAAGSCPVANYLRAKIPGATRVNVGTTIVDVTTPGEAYWDACGMPEACTEFVQKFDGLRYPDLVEQHYGFPPARKPTPNPKETDGR